MVPIWWDFYIMKSVERIHSARIAGVMGSIFVKLVFAYAVLTVASKVSIQIGPVPLTMQTCAVGLIGALLGARMGFSAVGIWVMSGFLGIPVFATPLHGLSAILGPTAGYLIAFPFAAALAGYLAQKGWSGKNLIKSFLNQYAVNLLAVLFGALWLSVTVNLEQALSAGFVPFVIPAILKALLAAGTLCALGLCKK